MLATKGWSVRDKLSYDEMIGYGPYFQARFESLVEAGQSPSMAAMLTVRKPPGTGIDDKVVMSGAKSVTEQFKGCEPMLNLYRKNYKAKTGENLPEDAVVYRSLVEEPGDPRFIVTNKHSLADVKRHARERNLQVEGDWENHPVQQAPQPQTVRMNDRVLATYKQHYLTQHEEAERNQKLKTAELEEMIVETHAPVVTPDDAMNAPTTLDECHKRTFAKLQN